MSQKTLFVIGAGASKEAQLPFGDAFKNEIRGATNIQFNTGDIQVKGDSQIHDALLQVAAREAYPHNPAPYFHAGRRIHAALVQAISIDHFLDAHKEDKRIVLCGKLAIVRTILTAEKRSLLHVAPGKALDYDVLDRTWYGSFLKLLTENCMFSGLTERLSSVTFVAFNYDRCVEHFLYHALQNYYGVAGDAVAPLLQRLEIYHPYGTVGSLPWQGKGDAIEFGGEPDVQQLLALATQIKTFTEEMESSSSQIDSIRKCVTHSQRIVFLGFAFHRMNIDLLMPQVGDTDTQLGRPVFGTALGISTSDVAIIRDELVARRRTFHPNVRLHNNLHCSQLFQEHWRGLSLV